MEFVEYHQADALERRIVLQTAGENPLGHHLDARLQSDAAVQADAIAHRLPDSLAQLIGHPLGSGASGQTPGLEHDDALPRQPGFVEQCERYAGGLAGAGRRFENRLVTRMQRAAQGRQGFVDGQ